MISSTGRLYDGLEAAVDAANVGLATPLSIGKVELARSIADLLSGPDIASGDAQPAPVMETALPVAQAEQQTASPTPSSAPVQPDQAPLVAAPAPSPMTSLVTLADLRALHGNFAVLFRELNRLQADAMRESTDEQVRQLTKRLVERFKRDHRTRATKHAFANMLAELESQLPGVTEETERIRSRIRKYREKYKLSEDPANDLDGFLELRGRLSSELVYDGIRGHEGLPATGA